MSAPRLLVLAPSLRRESYNQKLVRVVARGATQAGAEVTFVDLGEYPLPFYDGDLEATEGLPENASALRELFSSHQGLLLSSPEYNSSFPGLLKNTLDWISRSPKALPDLSPFQGKIVGLTAASPGPAGGQRVIEQLRRLLLNLGCVVLPRHLALRKAHEAFDENGELVNDFNRREAEAVGAEVSTWVARLDG